MKCKSEAWFGFCRSGESFLCLVKSDESDDGLESDDGCCVKRVSRILYRVSERITEQTPGERYFCSTPRSVHSDKTLHGFKSTVATMEVEQ